MPERQHTITTIRRALAERSGKPWSVKAGRGTASGWITITAPPRRCNNYGTMTAGDAAELGKLLGLPGAAHPQGVNVPDTTAFRTEYIARAKGEQPTVFGTRYWD